MDENTLTKEILKKRTRQLAGSKQIADVDHEEGLELVVFALGKESYGLEARQLKSIRPVSNYIPLPGVAPFIEGITNLSGVLYSIINLKRFLGLEETEAPANPKLLIIDHNTLKICFIVDQILAFKSVAETSLDSDITGIKSMEAGLIKGITKDALIVLNLEKVLNKIKKESK